MLQFLNVVYHAVHHPLCVYLDLIPQTETTQPFCCSDIAKYWLNRTQAFVVQIPALVTVYPVLHFVDHTGSASGCLFNLKGHPTPRSFAGLRIHLCCSGQTRQSFK